MSKQKKTNKQNKVTEKKQVNKNQQEEETQEAPFDKFTLMPELEELVKKNPNRNIGCGG